MYAQRPPDPRLASIVDAVWTSRSDGAPLVIAPDGCIDLVWHDGTGLFVSALLEAPELHTARGWWAGVRLRPGMARCLLDLDPVDCRGRERAARDLGRGLAELEERLSTTTPAQAVATLEAFALAHVEPARRPPPRVRRALQLLPARVDDLAARLEVTPRTLHRDLLAWTGLPPKRLTRFLRAQAAHADLEAGGRAAEVAAVHGYADQAHLSREMSEIFKT